MALPRDTLSISLFSEILTLEHVIRARIGKALPKGMELSHFIVLNHLAHVSKERTPAQLAQVLNLSRGAMTNTLSRLEWAGFVHIRPDWDDARRKQVSISPAGKRARDNALTQVAPLLSETTEGISEAALTEALNVLRGLRLGVTTKP